MDESALVKASQQGDRAVFGELIDRYYQSIYRLAYSYAGQHAVADDICQETFLRALDNIGTLKDVGRFEGWVFVIALNLLHKYRKVLGREKQMFEEDCDRATTKPSTNGVPDPLEGVAAKEKFALVHRYLQEMPDHLRAVAILVLMEGLTQRDAAEVTGYSEASVSRYLDQSRTWLRKRLQNLI